MKHIFIINPSAGKKDSSILLSEQIKTVYKDTDYEIYITKGKGDATNYVKSFEQIDTPICFYACGGDGTLHEVVNGMYHQKNASIAIIPIGTGNDFIKAIDIHKDHFLDLNKLKNGYEKKCDLLKVDQTVSLNIISVGLDAAIAANVSRFKKYFLVNGITAYYLSLAYCFFTSIKHNFKITTDHFKLPVSPYIFVVAGNGKYYGGGFYPTPKAKIDNGKMDVCIVKTISRLSILKFINVYKKGTHLEHTDLVTYDTTSKLQICAPEPLRLNVDGEIYYYKDPVIEIVPSAITLRLPN